MAWTGADWVEASSLPLSGGTLTGPLALPSAGLPVGITDFVVSASGAGVGALPTEAYVQIARGAGANVLQAGPGYNGGVAISEGDSYATITAWNGRPDIQLLCHHTALGSLSIASDGTIQASAGGADTIVFHSDGTLHPANADVQTLGTASVPWQVVYSRDGLVTVSDISRKADVDDCPLRLDFLRNLRPVRYRWADDKPDIHTGFIAQDVRASLPDGFSWSGWQAEKDKEGDDTDL